MIQPLPHSPQRFGFAVAASAVANLLLWYSLSQLSARVLPYRPPAVLEFSRVTIDEKGLKRPKIVKPVEIKKKKEEVKQKPPEPKKAPEPVHRAPKAPPPQGAHNKVLTSPIKSPVSGDHPFVAPTGGNAQVGTPDIQQPGNGTTNTTTPPVTPPPVQPPPQPPTQPVKPPPEQPVKPAPPPPPAPVKPTGPSRDAEPSYTINPTIPDSLLSQDFNKSVRVRVHIMPDGTFTVELRETCGNADVDKLAIEALKQWKWKPKLVDGVPVEDTQTFRFKFEVR